MILSAAARVPSADLCCKVLPCLGKPAGPFAIITGWARLQASQTNGGR